VPKPVSAKQARFMHALAEGKHFSHPRGTPPQRIAQKYTGHSTKGLPEQSGEDRGGTWGAKQHAKARIETKRQKSKAKREKVKESKGKAKHKARHTKKNLKKCFEDFYKGKGCGAVVVDKIGRILIGKQTDGRYATPGGHVDGKESYKDAAIRELKEETGLIGKEPQLITSGRFEGNDAKTFLITDYSGRVAPNHEFKSMKFMDITEIPYDNMRPCSREGLKSYLFNKMKVRKTLKSMLAFERLQKNIIRSKGDAVLEVTHGDSLRLVGNGAFRFLKKQVDGMKDEEFKDIDLADKKIHIRKHMNDIYSGRIYDGHKMVHQFQNKSLPALTAEIMSVFEWYLPEDEPELEVLDETDLSDDVIHGGLSTLLDNYKRHNLANIYDEMQNVRSEIRDGNVIDLIEVEKRIMKLFDKLERTIKTVSEKHNDLAEQAGDEIDVLEMKLRELQNKLDHLSQKPSVIEAYSASPVNPDKHLNEDYCYLPRPTVEVSPNGMIRIAFGKEWTPMDKENLLHDMKAKIIKNSNWKNNGQP
jgi:8-oxo-dGTP diphosphatase